MSHSSFPGTSGWAILHSVLDLRHPLFAYPVRSRERRRTNRMVRTGARLFVFE
jgi:hypothetical protein